MLRHARMGDARETRGACAALGKGVFRFQGFRRVAGLLALAQGCALARTRCRSRLRCGARAWMLLSVYEGTAVLVQVNQGPLGH